MWRAAHAYEGGKDKRKFGDSGGTFGEQVAHGRTEEVKVESKTLQCDSSVVIVTRACRLRLKSASKGGA